MKVEEASGKGQPHIDTNELLDVMGKMKPYPYTRVGSREHLGVFTVKHLSQFLSQYYDMTPDDPRFNKYWFEIDGLPGVGKSRLTRLQAQVFESIGQMWAPNSHLSRTPDKVRVGFMRYEDILERTGERKKGLQDRNYDRINSAACEEADELLKKNDLIFADMTFVGPVVDGQVQGWNFATDFARAMENPTPPLSRYRTKLIRTYLEGGPEVMTMCESRYIFNRARNIHQARRAAYAYGLVDKPEDFSEDDWDFRRKDGAPVPRIIETRLMAENVAIDLAADGRMSLPFLSLPEDSVRNWIGFHDRVLRPNLRPDDPEYDQKRMWKHWTISQMYEEIAVDSLKNSILGKEGRLDIYNGVNDPKRWELGIREEEVEKVKRELCSNSESFLPNHYGSL